MDNFSSDCWTESMCIQLIREFRKKPILWDPKDGYFYKKSMKPRAWQMISDKLNIPSEECKHKMSILMSSFRREKAKIVNSLKKAGDDLDVSQLYRSTWFAFREMSFLMDKSSERERQIRRGEIDEADEDTAILKKLKLSHPILSSNKQSVNPVEKECDKTSTEFVDPSRPEHEPVPGPSVDPCDTEEEIKSFAKFISVKMKKYSETTKNAVQQAICEIIFKADQDHFANGTNEKIFSTDNELTDKTLEEGEFNIEDDCISIKVESDVDYYSENSD